MPRGVVFMAFGTKNRMLGSLVCRVALMSEILIGFQFPVKSCHIKSLSHEFCFVFEQLNK